MHLRSNCRHIDRAKRARRILDPDFADARPNARHWLPIARLAAQLNQKQVVADFVLYRIGQLLEIFQKKTKPKNKKQKEQKTKSCNSVTSADNIWHKTSASTVA